MLSFHGTSSEKEAMNMKIGQQKLSKLELKEKKEKGKIPEWIIQELLEIFQG